MTAREIHALIADAVVAAELPAEALRGSDEPFARVLLREVADGAARIRNARDTLAAAMIAAKQPLDIQCEAARMKDMSEETDIQTL